MSDYAERSDQRLWRGTNQTRPAKVGKIIAKIGGKYTLELSDGRQIPRVGGFGSVSFEVDQFVTFNFKGSEYQILQPAPYSW